MTNNQTRGYYQEYCPSLKHLWTKYLEHDAVMTSNHAGPQKGGKEKPHFGFEVDDPRDKNQVFFTCYEEEVKISDEFDDYTMTHENCLKYLAQLPRPWYSYTN